MCVAEIQFVQNTECTDETWHCTPGADTTLRMTHLIEWVNAEEGNY